MSPVTTNQCCEAPSCWAGQVRYFAHTCKVPSCKVGTGLLVPANLAEVLDVMHLHMTQLHNFLHIADSDKLNGNTRLQSTELHVLMV